MTTFPKVQYRLRVEKHGDKYLLVDHFGKAWLNGRPTGVPAWDSQYNKHLSWETQEEALSHSPEPNRYEILPPDTVLIFVIVRSKDGKDAHFFQLQDESEAVSFAIRTGVKIIELVHTDGRIFIDMDTVERVVMRVSGGSS